MNKIDLQVKKIKNRGRIGLMTHVVVGYPDLKTTIELVKTMLKAGVDFVELQIPFSDPIADGPTIMKACDYALKMDTTIDDCFEILRQLSQQTDVPILIMSYYNSVFHYGVEAFCKRASQVGASGLIIPDMPPDEETHEHFIQTAKKYGLYQIRVVTPASSDERLKLNAQVADGFVYCVSHYGVTGSKANLQKSLQSYIKRVKKYFDLPVALGFGISKPEHIQSIKNEVDIAVIGSAVLKIIEKHKNQQKIMKEITLYIETIKQSSNRTME